MELESVPPENSCLGCKRYFLRGEKLPLENMVVEFKNYSFPIKGSFLKLTLLKTIVGFMNSKGGTLYMGVDDASGNVEGVTLGRK
jgi:predicted HTH transcriptional regulator